MGDIVFSPTMLLIGFFAMLYLPNFRKKVTDAFKINQTSIQNTAKETGKKGKKVKKKSSSDSGGMFGMMNQQQQTMNKQIGEIVEPEDIKTGFADVAGCEEAKIEVIEI